MSCGEEMYQKLFDDKPVVVKAADYIIKGVLKAMERSTHNGFGNLALQTANGLVLIRGNHVRLIATRGGKKAEMRRLFK